VHRADNGPGHGVGLAEAEVAESFVQDRAHPAFGLDPPVGIKEEAFVELKP